MLKFALVLCAAVATIIGLSYLPMATGRPDPWNRSIATNATTVKATTIAKGASGLRPGVRLTLPRTYHGRRVRHFQWLRCNHRGQRCKAIRGATHRSYRVRLADVGHTLRARVVTWQGSVTAVTAPTAQIGRPLPVNTAVPTLSDDCASGTTGCLADPTASGAVVTVGDNLTGTNGTWKHAVRFTYQWMDCDSTGANCVAISGATSQTYTIQDSDVGSTIVFQVTAYNF